MNIISLHPTDIDDARITINTEVNNDPVFIMTSTGSLGDYIQELGLKSGVQYKLRICKEMPIDVILVTKDGNIHAETLGQLLENIDISQKSTVVVRGDINVSVEREKEVHQQLSDIVQQFIYLNIPLSKVSVCTEKEAADSMKIEKFVRNYSHIKSTLETALANINSVNDETNHYKNDIFARLSKIQGYMDEAMNNELTISVAASKKSGKSMIVNSIIGCELAPTSLKLATPNNCIYRKSFDNRYHLRFKKKGYVCDQPYLMREQLYKLFKQAEKNVKEGYGLPDMELFYPSETEELSKYIIYDTPGPDLAGADGHYKAADRGIEAADVIVFVIDYSKHLIQTEYDYLKKVKALCDERNKNYSLIVCVNMLDRRYVNEGDKNITSILDFIKENLIRRGDNDGIDFRSCIFVGTTALTYFNSLAAPKLKTPDGDCSILENEYSSETVEDLIASYDEPNDLTSEYEDRAKSILQQLYDMTNYAKTYHKMKITSLDEMKHFSGMPNFLSYLSYIATQKARNEKVNSIMFKIDSEYRVIMNQLQIGELMRKIEENKEKTNEARKIMKNFKSEAYAVLDPKYTELYNDYNSHIYPEFENMQSDILLELTQKIPIKLPEVTDIYGTDVKKTLNFNRVMEEVTKRLEVIIARKLRESYGNDDKKLIEKDSAIEHYKRCLSEACVEATSLYISDRKDELGKKLEKEKRAIADTFSYVLSERLRKLREIVGKYSDQLYTECMTYLPVDLPVFQITLGGNIVINSSPVLKGNDFSVVETLVEKAINELDHFHDGKTEGFIGRIRKLFGTGKTISLGNMLKVYEHEKLGIYIKGVYEKNGELSEYLDSVMYPLQNEMQLFIEQIGTDIDMIESNLYSGIKQVGTVIDITEKMESESKELRMRKDILEKLKKACSEFNTSWKGVAEQSSNKSYTLSEGVTDVE